MSFKKVPAQVSFPKLEEEVLKFWEKNKIFEKSVEKNPEDKTFIFYEGPPTANGKPGLHHVLVRSFKDIIPRYKTMKGFRVERKAGWDTHGLPVELQVEKALGLKNKQDIENIVPGDKRASIIKFNEECKKSVWEYRDLWEKMTERMGYWVDMEHPYVTYENEYIESVWWQLAQIAKMKIANNEHFLYKGHKVVPYCYRCGTALSSHEVAQGYKEVKDSSVYVKFKVKPGQKIKDFVADDNTYIIAWTTTPWTLPGNVALAVRPNTNYSINEMIPGNGLSGDPKNEKYILARELHRVYESDERTPSIVAYADSQDLVGKIYETLFEIAGETLERSVILGGFVTLDSGTGIVHIAPAFGEDDANVAREYGLPTLHTVSDDGKMDEGFPGAGIPVKKLNDKNRYAVDDLIIEDLKQRKLLFKEEFYIHEYPFCWRCDTPLIYFAKPSWFIRMSELREALVANNEKVEWVPEHIKEGRFGEWLRGAKDWAISRERYWGTPLPIWECHGENAAQIGCGNREIISSIKELEEKSGKKLEDLHKPYIDEVTLKCDHCGGVMERTPEVLDVWFDSGAMPLAQFSYPNNVDEATKKKIEAGKYFPADYICEAIDQTRGWFYTLHAIATLLNKAEKVSTGYAYKNVICLGHVLDAQGKKMSKSKGNVIDPFEMFDQFGADQLRWFFFSINNPGLPKRFDVKDMKDIQNRLFRMLWNSYSFFTTYATLDKFKPQENSISTVKFDKWILSELFILTENVGKWLDNYHIYPAVHEIEAFIDNLSNWYIRRSRKRFWKNENDEDKEQAYQTLYTVLVELSKLMAPFTPFLAEEIYRNLTGKESVHLENWTEEKRLHGDVELIKQMGLVRHLVAEGLRKRSASKVKVRQPLKSATIQFELDPEFQEIMRDELNVKELLVSTEQQEPIAIDFEITPELKLEGEAREVIRAIQEGRKKAGFNVEDRIVLKYQGKDTVFNQFRNDIAKEVLAVNISPLRAWHLWFYSFLQMIKSASVYTETVELEGEKFTFALKRVA